MSDKNNNLNEEEFEEEFDQVTLTLDGDFLLYRFIDNGDGNYDLDDIGDDEEFEAASEAFDELMDNEDYDEMFGDEDE